MVLKRISACALICIAVGAAACGDDYGGGSGTGIDATPEKLDGSSSQEFESDDIERAENASPEVEAYCDGAVSEAQRVGCLSHVEESDIP